MQARSDEQLLNDFRGGREAAFGVLVERHGPGIKGYATRILRSPDQAEDVFAETFLRVATGAVAFVGRGSVRGWLYTIARRLCIDAIRHRDVERASAHTVFELTRGRAVRPSPEASMVLGERALALENALQALSPPHREVVTLRLVNELTAAECAEILGLSESQVHSQLSYARKQLCALLETEAPVEARSRP